MSSSTLPAESVPQPTAPWYEAIAERGHVPDWILRAAIRRLLAQRLRAETKGGPERQQARLVRYLEQLKASPIAIHTPAANEQHYEIPAEFFAAVLGAHRKYSCCYWQAGDSLDQAERRMLDLTAQRAQLKDGHSILDLGCGWGAFSLYAAARFPHSSVTGVSNSHSQRQFIEKEARARGLSNLRILTADINDFAAGQQFDRIVSVEMLEHVRNYRRLLRNVSSWLQPDGLFFVHIFSHRQFAYPFEVKDSRDWMAQYFFTGGQMPSANLLLYFQDDLRIRDQWALGGRHYQRTANAWLAKMDSQRPALLELFATIYGRAGALKWFVRWRIFFLACAELFGYRGGAEWLVSHYLFEPAADRSPPSARN